MKIALLFRGPLRPDPGKVIENTQQTINELKEAGHEVRTFLATWPTYNHHSAEDLKQQNMFDHVIITEEPSPEYVRQYVNRPYIPGSHSTIDNVFKMYVQSKNAIDVILQTGNFDRIIHSRTDIIVRFGSYLDNWLALSETKYVRQRCDAAWWINDTIGMSTPSIMQRAWDWHSLEELGLRIDQVSLPEEVLMSLMADNEVNHIPEDTEQMILDPSRFR